MYTEKPLSALLALVQAATVSRRVVVIRPNAVRPYTSSVDVNTWPSENVQPIIEDPPFSIEVATELCGEATGPQKALLEAMIANQKEKRGVQYTHMGSRLYGQGFQKLRADYRTRLGWDTLPYFDFTNCYPVIICQIKRPNGEPYVVPGSKIHRYWKSRDEVLTELSQSIHSEEELPPALVRTICKLSVLYALMGMPISGNINILGHLFAAPPYLREFAAEAAAVRKNVFADYKDILPYKIAVPAFGQYATAYTERSTQDALLRGESSCFVHLVQSYELRLLHLAWNFVKDQGYSPRSLLFDGFAVLPHEELTPARQETLAKEISDHLYYKTGIRIEIHH